MSKGLYEDYEKILLDRVVLFYFYLETAEMSEDKFLCSLKVLLRDVSDLVLLKELKKEGKEIVFK